MKSDWLVMLRPMGFALALLCAGTLTAVDAAAQPAVPADWSAQGCSSGGCHGAPPSFGGNIDFSDATLFSSLSNFVARIGKVSSNSTMRTFSTNANVGLVYNYLVNVRDTYVTPSVAAFPDAVLNSDSGATRQITIANYRGEALGYTLSLDNTDDFSYTTSTPGCATSVPAAAAGAFASCTVTVSFAPKPASLPARSANLTITYLAAGVSTPVPGSRSVALTGTAQPAIEVSPSIQSFTTTTSVTKTFTITDRVGNQIQLCRRSAAVLDGKTNYTFADPYALTGDCHVIAAAVSGTVSATAARVLNDVNITFQPGSITTPLNALLEATELDSTNTPIVVQAQLNGNAGAVQAVDHVTMFDGVTKEVDGNVVADDAVTVVSQGNLDLIFDPTTPFTIADSALSPSGVCGSVPLATNSGEYTVVAGGCQSLPSPKKLDAYTGNPAPSCALNVRFDPSALGTRCAVLSIRTNAGESRVVLQGAGHHGPRLTIDGAAPNPAGTSLDFTSQRPGHSYPAKRLTLANGGSAGFGNFELSLPASGSVPGFTIVPTAGTNCTSLAPGASPPCTIDITFVPTAIQAYSGSFDILGRVEGASAYVPFHVSLVGQGTDHAPVLKWRNAANTEIASFDFGPTFAGTPGVTSVYLSNDGPGSASLQLVNAVGVDAGNFTLKPNNCSLVDLLAEHGLCEFVVTFAPGTAGPKTALVQVVSDGNLATPLALLGTGVAASTPATLTISQPPPLSGATVGGQSVPVDVTLSSTGSIGLHVTALEVVGPFVVQSKSCPALPFVLLAGNQCQVTVSFKPTADGHATGVLRVTTDASATALEVTLTGDAQPAANVSSGGGCSIASRGSLVDPALWSMALLALVVLLVRRRERRARRDGP